MIDSSLSLNQTTINRQPSPSLNPEQRVYLYNDITSLDRGKQLSLTKLKVIDYQ